MTKEEAKNILVHYDDLVYQQDNGITIGMIADAIQMATEALDESNISGSSDIIDLADADYKMLKEKNKTGEAVLHYNGFLDGFGQGWGKGRDYMIDKAARWLTEHFHDDISDGEMTCSSIWTDGPMIDEFKKGMRK